MSSNSTAAPILKVFTSDDNIHRVRLSSIEFQAAVDSIQQVAGAGHTAFIEQAGGRVQLTPESWRVATAAAPSVLRVYIAPAAPPAAKAVPVEATEAAPAEAAEPVPEPEACAETADMEVEPERPSNSGLEQPAPEPVAALAPAPEASAPPPSEPALPPSEPEAPQLEPSAPPLDGGSQRPDGPVPADHPVMQGISGFFDFAVQMSPDTFAPGIRAWQHSAQAAVQAHARANEQALQAHGRAVEEHGRAAAAAAQEHARAFAAAAEAHSRSVQQQAEAVAAAAQEHARAVAARAEQHARAAAAHAEEQARAAAAEAQRQAGQAQHNLAAPTPPGQEHTLPVEAGFMWMMPVAIRDRRVRLQRGMIMGNVEIINAEVFLEDSMITGTVSLQGHSRLVAVRSGITGPVMRSATSSVENRHSMVTGPVVQV